MTRNEILDEAKRIICGDRDQQYGSPEDNFATIARLWSDYLGHPIEAVDVGIMMTLFKIARIMTGTHKDDSYIDAIGYMACAAEIAGEMRGKEQ